MKDDGTMAYNHVSVAKRENVRSALKAARSAREILGGSGITLDYGVIRHMLNLETVDTYEGTRDVHSVLHDRRIRDPDNCQEHFINNRTNRVFYQLKPDWIKRHTSFPNCGSTPCH